MTAEPLLDRLLDRTVVGGYTRLGYAVRRRSWPDDDPAPDSLVGRRALVTGAGGGLGEATALGLARLGATVHLLGRTPERVGPALERIAEELAAEGLTPSLHAEGCDVSDLDAVRRFAVALNARLAEDGDALDVLVHNAGVLPAERRTSAQGHELTYATHVLGPVLLTDLLLPSLRRSGGGARVVLVSSGGMYAQELPVDDLEYAGSSYRGAVAYARSKRVQVEITPLLAEHLAADGVGVHVMHPGWADTPGVADSLPLFRAVTAPVLRSDAEGADTVVWLAATRPAPPPGLLWHDRRPRPTSYLRSTRSTPDEVGRVWSQVRDAVRCPAPAPGPGAGDGGR